MDYAVEGATRVRCNTKRNNYFGHKNSYIACPKYLFCRHNYWPYDAGTILSIRATRNIGTEIFDQISSFGFWHFFNFLPGLYTYPLARHSWIFHFSLSRFGHFIWRSDLFLFPHIQHEPNIQQSLHTYEYFVGFESNRSVFFPWKIRAKVVTK